MAETGSGKRGSLDGGRWPVRCGGRPGGGNCDGVGESWADKTLRGRAVAGCAGFAGANGGGGGGCGVGQKYGLEWSFLWYLCSWGGLSRRWWIYDRGRW